MQFGGLGFFVSMEHEIQIKTLHMWQMRYIVVFPLFSLSSFQRACFFLSQGNTCTENPSNF